MRLVNIKSAGLMVLAMLFFSACKDHYDPKIKNSGSHFLVVEGYINAAGQTTINLSRTRNITWGDTASYINEPNASITIEDKFNNVYPLYDNGGGMYSAFYYLPTNGQYRLHIITADNKEYRSDFVDCKISPFIQDVNWEFNEGSVWIYASTGDPANNTHFYRWNFSETWEFHSQYRSDLIYDRNNITVVPRTNPVYVCYRNDNSSEILLGSSIKLKEDVIDKKVLQKIPPHDKRISVLYSILVTQYALDSAAYNYWDAMKSNTEEVGSIFSSQPNQTQGNIHCISDNSETVIGYVGAGIPQEKRIFISNTSMPPNWNLTPNCTEYEVPNIKDSLKYYFENNSFVPYEKDSTRNGGMKGYLSASGTCVDCTLTGSPVKPAFWP